MYYAFLAFSLITVEFQENSDKYIGWLEAAGGIGLTIGPALGSLIYEYTSYTTTFLIYGCILFLGTLVIAFTLPSEVNSGEPLKLSLLSKNHPRPRRVEQVNYSMFLKNVRCLFTLFASMLMQILLCFLDSILAYHITKTYAIDEKLMGYIFVIPCLIYTLACPFVSHFFDKKKYDRRLLITFSFFVASVSLLFTGPSQLLEIPE